MRGFRRLWRLLAMLGLLLFSAQAFSTMPDCASVAQANKAACLKLQAMTIKSQEAALVATPLNSLASSLAATKTPALTQSNKPSASVGSWILARTEFDAAFKDGKALAKSVDHNSTSTHIWVVVLGSNLSKDIDAADSVVASFDKFKGAFDELTKAACLDSVKKGKTTPSYCSPYVSGVHALVPMSAPVAIAAALLNVANAVASEFSGQVVRVGIPTTGITNAVPEGFAAGITDNGHDDVLVSGMTPGGYTELDSFMDPVTKASVKATMAVTRATRLNTQHAKALNATYKSLNAKYQDLLASLILPDNPKSLPSIVKLLVLKDMESGSDNASYSFPTIADINVVSAGGTGYVFHHAHFVNDHLAYSAQVVLVSSVITDTADHRGLASEDYTPEVMSCVGKRHSQYKWLDVMDGALPAKKKISCYQYTSLGGDATILPADP